MGLLDRAVDKLKAEGEPAKDAAARADSETSAAAGGARVAPGQAVGNAGDAGTGDSVALDLAGLASKGFLVPGYPCDSVMLDEYRRIKRQLLFRVSVEQAEDTQGLPGNLIMVTSALDGEGKTFVSSNLAFSISLEVDRSALLIDGDVIRRGCSQLLGLETRAGLIDYLRGETDDLAGLLVQPEGIDNLQILPTGHPHKNANELLASHRMRDLIEELAYQNPERTIIIDTPPLLMTSEASVLAQQVGQIVLVVRADRTPQHHIQQAVAMIPKERLTGTVLNAATRNLAQDGYADYYYGDD